MLDILFLAASSISVASTCSQGWGLWPSCPLSLLSPTGHLPQSSAHSLQTCLHTISTWMSGRYHSGVVYPILPGYPSPKVCFLPVFPQLFHHRAWSCLDLFLHFVSIISIKQGAKEVAQQLRSLAILLENGSLVPSTHIWWLTTAINSSLKGSDLAWPPWASTHR